MLTWSCINPIKTVFRIRHCPVNCIFNNTLSPSGFLCVQKCMPATHWQLIMPSTENYSACVNHRESKMQNRHQRVVIVQVPRHQCLQVIVSQMCLYIGYGDMVEKQRVFESLHSVEEQAAPSMHLQAMFLCILPIFHTAACVDWTFINYISLILRSYEQ